MLGYLIGDGYVGGKTPITFINVSKQLHDDAGRRAVLADGYRTPFLISIIVDMNYTVFGWTFGVFDTAKPGVEQIRRRVRKRLRPGAIVLLHDGDGYDPEGDRMQTANALPGIIEDAQADGYGFGSLSELLGNHS